MYAQRFKLKNNVQKILMITSVIGMVHNVKRNFVLMLLVQPLMMRVVLILMINVYMEIVGVLIKYALLLRVRMIVSRII